MRKLHLTALGLAVSVSSATFAVTPVPTVYNSFNEPAPGSDAQWIGVNNRPPGSPANNNNFGWSDTDNTGNTVVPLSGKVSGTGEMGGPIQRGTVSEYGFPTGTIDASNSSLHADGVYRYGNIGSGTWFFGWYSSASHITAGGDPRNFIGLQFDDSKDIYSHVANAGDNNRGHAGVIPTDSTVSFTMDYDGAGNLTGSINGLSFSAGKDMTGVMLDRFGLFPGSTSSNTGGGFFDDLTFSSFNPVVVPEPASLGLLVLRGILLGRRRKL